MVMTKWGKKNPTKINNTSVILSSENAVLKTAFICCPIVQDKCKYFGLYKQALT